MAILIFYIYINNNSDKTILIYLWQSFTSVPLTKTRIFKSGNKINIKKARLGGLMYRWVLAFHVIAVICWFAALFYLPRLFVYNAMSEDVISIERFKIMQRKLYRGIANPSMIATLGLGMWLVSMAPVAYLSATWF